jgi:MarR family 2-MHQ and catechol resistance regulon transcriptional repressor
MSGSQLLKNLIFRIVKEAKNDFERRFVQAKITITPFEFTLASLIKHKPTTLADLAKRLGIKPPSASPYVETLERKHLIAKQKDPKDRRKIYLHLTKKGEKLLTHITKDHPKDILNQAFHKLPKPKQSQLINLLQQLNDQLK